MPPSSKKFGNHYDTLGLKESCTSKEVKDAFLTLSKIHHPDLNSNDPSHKEKFVKIYEAYEVLCRPDRRLVYDSDLRFRERMAQSGQNLNVETDAPRYTTWRDESIWSMRDKSKTNDTNKPYYGIKGINRVSNYWIAGGTIVVMLFGTFFHYTALKHGTAFTIAQLDTRDEKLARKLYKVRQTAEDNGNDMQIDIMKEKFGWSDLKSDEKR